MSLEAQSALAGGVGQRFHAAMEQIGPTVEHDRLHARLGGALGESLADLGSGVLIGAVVDLEILLHARRGGQGAAARIIDDLSVDVLFRPEDRQPRAAIGPRLDRAADTRLAAL